MVAQTFFSGVIMLSIWIMSEYIARIYDESKKRPQYIIKETINVYDADSGDSDKNQYTREKSEEK